MFSCGEKFDLSTDLYLALAVLDEGSEPRLFLIPSEAWKELNTLLVDRDYIGKEQTGMGCESLQEKHGSIKGILIR